MSDDERRRSDEFDRVYNKCMYRVFAAILLLTFIAAYVSRLVWGAG